MVGAGADRPTCGGERSVTCVCPRAHFGLGDVFNLVYFDLLVFVGSVNLDPRSKRINTEMGALIHSPELAAETADAIARLMTPANAWRVDTAADGQLVWRSDEAVLNRQPARNGGQRLADFVFGLLPVRDQI